MGYVSGAKCHTFNIKELEQMKKQMDASSSMTCDSRENKTVLFISMNFIVSCKLLAGCDRESQSWKQLLHAG